MSQPSERALRLAEHNRRKGTAELREFVHTLMRDTYAEMRAMECADVADAESGECSVCLGDLRQPVDCACGSCKKQSRVVRRLRCCGQSLHSYCLEEYVCQQFHGDLFLDTMDEILAWMVMGHVVNLKAVLAELTATKNFLCCPLCRAPISSQSTSNL